MGKKGKRKGKGTRNSKRYCKNLFPWLEVEDRVGIVIKKQPHLQDKDLPFVHRAMEILLTAPATHIIPDDPLLWIPFPRCKQQNPWGKDFEPLIDLDSTPDPIFFTGTTVFDEHLTIIRSFKNSSTKGVSFTQIEALHQVYAQDKLLDLGPASQAAKCLSSLAFSQPPGYEMSFTSGVHGFRLESGKRGDTKPTNFGISDFAMALLDHSKPTNFAYSKKSNFAYWTCFKAALAIGDLHSCNQLFSKARREALQLGTMSEWAEAIWTLTKMSSKAEYSSVTNDVIFYAVDCGESFDRLSVKTFPNAKRRAIAAYKLGAMYAISHPNSAPLGMYANVWNCLAVAIKRQGHYDMAERAYRHALHATQIELAHPLHNSTPKSCTLEHSLFHRILASYSQLCHDRASNDQKAVAKTNKKNIKKNNATVAKTNALDNVVSLLIICGHCGEKLAKTVGSKCSGCRIVYYCTPSCQRKHWKEHKKECRIVQAQRKAAKTAKKQAKKDEEDRN